jgi:hypothetical protein
VTRSPLGRRHSPLETLERPVRTNHATRVDANSTQSVARVPHDSIYHLVALVITIMSLVSPRRFGVNGSFSRPDASSRPTNIAPPTDKWSYPEQYSGPAILSGEWRTCATSTRSDRVKKDEVYHYPISGNDSMTFQRPSRGPIIMRDGHTHTVGHNEPHYHDGHTIYGVGIHS